MRRWQSPQVDEQESMAHGQTQTLERSVGRRLQIQCWPACHVPGLSLGGCESDRVDRIVQRLARYLTHCNYTFVTEPRVRSKLDCRWLVQRVERCRPNNDAPILIPLICQPNQVLAHPLITQVVVSRLELPLRVA